MRSMVNQIKRDFRTEAVIVPNKRKRYAFYVVFFLSASLVACSVKDTHSLELLAGLIILFGSLTWFLRKVYEYLQQGG